METIYFILLLLGAICFAVAFVSVWSRRVYEHFDLVSLGLLFWILVPLIQAGRAL